MNRQIEFRGKLLNTNVWIYGNLRIHLVDGDLEQKSSKYFIEYNYMNKDGKVYRDSYEVDPSTVGQFTGLFNKNDKRIYEGDIVNSIDSDISGNVYGVDELELEDMTDFSLMASLNYSNELEVIGNIFDEE